MTKLNFERPLWALALIIMALVLAWQCESKHNDTLEAKLAWQELNEKEGKIIAAIKAADSTMLRVEARRVKDSLKFKARINDLVQSVNHWRGEARKVRPIVVDMSDSIPVLKAYIAATDSTIKQQDSVISVQSLHLVNQQKLYENEIAVMGAKNLQQQQLTDVWKNAAVKREKDLKKANRPVSLGVSAGPGIIVTPTGQFYGGLTANVGVSFKLRFRK